MRSEEDIPQDPGIPGVDIISDDTNAELPDSKDESAEARERLDDADDEGHLS